MSLVLSLNNHALCNSVFRTSDILKSVHSFPYVIQASPGKKGLIQSNFGEGPHRRRELSYLSNTHANVTQTHLHSSGLEKCNILMNKQPILEHSCR